VHLLYRSEALAARHQIASPRDAHKLNRKTEARIFLFVIAGVKYRPEDCEVKSKTGDTISVHCAFMNA
jgi:hypothetical protein